MPLADLIFWREVMNVEIDSILSNNTSELVNFQAGCKPIGCELIFKKRLYRESEVTLVAKDIRKMSKFI